MAGRFSGLTETIEYTWPAVVVERKLPIRDAGILIPVGYGLGRVAVGPLGSRRLAAALRSAGFTVIEVNRWGWEAPHTVSEYDLDGYADQVPACVVAPT
jgi:hypothetical protein